jgi:hypothetical protein
LHRAYQDKLRQWQPSQHRCTNRRSDEVSSNHVLRSTDEEGRAFVFVKPDSGDEDFVAGEAFRNNALQVEFVPQPDVAGLTIQYLDAISALLKSKAQELPVKDV